MPLMFESFTAAATAAEDLKRRTSLYEQGSYRAVQSMLTVRFEVLLADVSDNIANECCWHCVV